MKREIKETAAKKNPAGDPTKKTGIASSFDT